MSFKILTLNNISVRGLERLPRDRYEVASEIGHPDAVMLRSADMHAMEIPASSVTMPFGSVGHAKPVSPCRSVPISPRDTSAKNSTCGA